MAVLSWGLIVMNVLLGHSNYAFPSMTDRLGPASYYWGNVIRVVRTQVTQVHQRVKCSKILQNVFALLKKLLEVEAVSEIQGATVASIINREIIA
jgi:hypothetical protein